MQEEFNENYMESDKYPKSAFKGNITDIGSVDLSKDGNYIVHIKGEVTMHGVTKNISTTGNIKIKNGNISATASFKVLLADYYIKIPTIVTDKIARDIEVTVSCNYEKKSSN